MKYIERKLKRYHFLFSSTWFMTEQSRDTIELSDYNGNAFYLHKREAKSLLGFLQEVLDA